LNGFPERSDIHRTVQSEQRPFEGWIDHRYWFPPGFKNPLPLLHVLCPRLREVPFVVPLLDNVRLSRRSTIEKEKRQPKLPRDYQATRESENSKPERKQETKGGYKGK
jgi:hypothetical protein